MALLEIDHLTVRFGGVTALDDVNFTVDEGEFVSIIGPNGAGKTTLFNVIAGVRQPTAGKVRLRGRDMHGAHPARMSHLGVRRSFQVARPFRSLTVNENVRVAAAGKRILYSQRAFALRGRDRVLNATVESLLAQTGLSGSSRRRAGELNIGELRRLEIARALAGNPDVLLLDEPAAGIGADGLRPLVELIKAVRVLLVEHYVGLALSLSDRVVVLDEGHLIANAAPDEVRHDERVISAYLGKSASARDEERSSTSAETQPSDLPGPQSPPLEPPSTKRAP
jgi:ABC-type branched-subunit amino acid transport system ATPase component